MPTADTAALARVVREMNAVNMRLRSENDALRAQVTAGQVTALADALGLIDATLADVARCGANQCPECREAVLHALGLARDALAALDDATAEEEEG